MLKRLLGLTLLSLALLLMLGLLVGQAEAPPKPLGALPACQAALAPQRPQEGDLALEEGQALAAVSLDLFVRRLFPLPQAPEARAAYYRRCFSAFHYSDRAG